MGLIYQQRDNAIAQTATALLFGRAVETNPGDDLLSPAKDYHRPWMLNGRVRNGNGWDHPGMLTEKIPNRRDQPGGSDRRDQPGGSPWRGLSPPPG
jgi:hypothetical protein